MIQSFKDEDTFQLFIQRKSRRWSSLAAVALRKLEAAGKLSDLAVPPGNRLEALRGDRHGQHSIRINDQWRICFLWSEEGAEEVEIVDYH